MNQLKNIDMDIRGQYPVFKNLHLIKYRFFIIHFKIHTLLYNPTVYLDIFYPFIDFCCIFTIFLILTLFNIKLKVFTHHVSRSSLKNETIFFRNIWAEQREAVPNVPVFLGSFVISEILSSALLCSVVFKFKSTLGFR